jgi:hypothetical protein
MIRREAAMPAAEAGRWVKFEVALPGPFDEGMS